MLLHAAPDRQLKKKEVDVDICREVLVMEMVIFWVIAMGDDGGDDDADDSDDEEVG